MSSISKSITSNKANYFSQRKRELGITLLIVLVLWLVFDLSGVGGNIRFYAKWATCGQKPIVTNSHGTFEGDVPYYEASPTFDFMRFSTPLYCTPLQAEEAGYSASPRQYEFPAIEKYNAAHPSNKILPGRQ